MFVKSPKNFKKSKAKGTTHGHTINLLEHDVIKAEFHRFRGIVHKLTERALGKLGRVKSLLYRASAQILIVSSSGHS